MSRQLDLLIENKIFGNKDFIVENEVYYAIEDNKKKVLPFYSTDHCDCYKVLDKLKMSTLISFNYMYLGEHMFDSRDEGSNNRWHASHKNYCAAICLAALYSTKCNKEEILDALFSYNFYFGII